MNDPATIEERNRVLRDRRSALFAAEALVAENWDAFVVVATELRRIQRRRLFEDRWRMREWDDYLKQRWGVSKSEVEVKGPRQQDLISAEALIAENWDAFVVAATNLRHIQRRRLHEEYRRGWEWEDYLQRNWKLSAEGLECFEIAREAFDILNPDTDADDTGDGGGR